MRCLSILSVYLLLHSVLGFAANVELPAEMLKIMKAQKYEHAIWGLYVQDLEIEKVLFDYNSNLMFSPASTTKLFSVAALLHAFGDDYRYKTPVYADGKIDNGRLDGNLILVGQGDFIFGGREISEDTLEYTKLDHITANDVPGTVLTKGDPLTAVNRLAEQVRKQGIKEIHGDVVIDDTLFDTTEKRGMILSPISINENLIDIVINPTEPGQLAQVTWRPQVPGYEVKSALMTVAKGEPVSVEISSDESGQRISVKGTVPVGEKDLVRTSTIKNPKEFARAAFVQALKNEGIALKVPAVSSGKIPDPSAYRQLSRIGIET